MATRYVADAVVTCDAESHVYRPGVVDVEDGRISWVGPAADAPDRTCPEQRLDGIVFPGFVNTHCHTPMTLFRGAAEDIALNAFLREVLWPREARLTPDDVYWGMLLGCAELLRGGVTTTCEMYLFEQAMAAAVYEAGTRCVLTPAVIEVPQWGDMGSWEKRLEAVLAFIDAAATDEHVELGIAAHSAYALPLPALDAIAAAARERDALVHIHLAETADEAADVERAHGRSVPALLADRGFFDARVLAAHGVWLSNDDLRICAEHDVAVAHCPQSNAKLASGIARLDDMLQRGMRVGLGTDGPASNNNLDMWEEMRLAPLLARLRTGRPDVLTTNQALALATRGGAEALGRRDIGALETGRYADMVVIRTDHPTFVPVSSSADLTAHLLWAADARLVTDVWVGGRHVVSDGQCRTIDEERARAEVQRRALRLADSL